MIAALRPVPADPDPDTRSPAVFRSGLRAARQELRAGSARRLHLVPDADPSDPPDPSVGAAADPASSPPGSSEPFASSESFEPEGDGADGDGVDLATQRAGVRAALIELRQHRGQP